MKIAPIVAIGLIVGLAGCVTTTSTFAYKPKTTNQSKAEDWIACEIEATQRGQTYGGGVNSYDANLELLWQATKMCMRNRGYQLVEVEKCAANVEFPESHYEKASSSSFISIPEAGTCMLTVDRNVGVMVPKPD